MINKYYRTPSIWKGWNDAYLEEFQSRFALIKGISSDTIDDIKNMLATFRQNYAVTKLFGGFEEVIRKDLHGHDHILNVSEVEQFINMMREEKEIYKSNDIVKLINEYESVFSEKLSPVQVKHMMTLIRLFEGTPNEIQNSLVGRKII